MSATPFVVDSSVWVEVLKDGPLAKACLHEFRAAKRVLVPTIVLFEVYRKCAVSPNVGEDLALSAIALMSQYEVVELTRKVALDAADLSIQHRLAMADSIVLAHARCEEAILLTLDNDFADLPNAKVLRAK